MKILRMKTVRPLKSCRRPLSYRQEYSNMYRTGCQCWLLPLSLTEDVWFSAFLGNKEIDILSSFYFLWLHIVFPLALKVK